METRLNNYPHSAHNAVIDRYAGLVSDIVDMIYSDTPEDIIDFDGAQWECCVDSESELRRVGCDRDSDPREWRYILKDISLTCLTGRGEIDSRALDFSRYRDIIDRR